MIPGFEMFKVTTILDNSIQTKLFKLLGAGKFSENWVIKKPPACEDEWLYLFV
jgi:hypothetical protein